MLCSCLIMVWGQYEGNLAVALWLLTLAGLQRRMTAKAERSKGHSSGQGGRSGEADEKAHLRGHYLGVFEWDNASL